MNSVELKVNNIFKYYEKYGNEGYLGERVTQLEHATQCAMMAEKCGSSDELILAAFFHDIGHLIGKDLPNSKEMITENTCLGIENHEVTGAKFLESLGFSSKFTAVIRFHVDAKRYLCFKDQEYLKVLSDASKQTLKHQGGIMSEDEAAEFEKNEMFQEILKMRMWDEKAKLVGIDIEPLEKYKNLLTKYLCANVNSDN